MGKEERGLLRKDIVDDPYNFLANFKLGFEEGFGGRGDLGDMGKD